MIEPHSSLEIADFLFFGTGHPFARATLDRYSSLIFSSSSINMSFLFGGRPQLSSAEKIAAAETEVEMVSDMFNR